MGSRCYECGEKFGRCYEHAGNCPDGCTFGTHPCRADASSDRPPTLYGFGLLAGSTSDAEPPITGGLDEDIEVIYP